MDALHTAPVPTLTPGLVATLRTLRKLVRNPIEAWPPAVYTEPLVLSRMLGRTTAFVSDPDLVQRVLVDEAEKFEKAEPMRRALEPALGQGILTAEGASWRMQRRLAAPVFRPAHVNGFLPAMLQAARVMRDRWLALPEGAELEVTHEMMHVTFDIILETMLSGRGDTDVARVEAGMRAFLESTSWAVALSALRAPLWTPYPGKGRAMRGGGYLRQMVSTRVAQRQASGERHDDLLSLMLDAADPETGEALSSTDIVNNILTFIAAGHETTALALTWTFYVLSRNPAIEAAILAEIETVTGGADLAPAQVAELGFTRQVIQESMRVFPPVALLVRQPTEDVQLGPARLLRGDNVFIPIYAIHKNASLWPEPEKFDPARFTAEAIKARHRWSYLPFGAGPRICIGMGFAMLEAAAILATVLPAIRLRAPADFVPTPKLRVTMRPAEGMRMRLSHRTETKAC
jgi:cytochrome P450